MKTIIHFEDLKRSDYKEVWDYQESLLQKVISQKENQQTHKINYLLFCEHPHVFTLGKNGNVSNLLANSKVLKEIDAVFCKTNRGGDITYHGPGQIVVYPIIDLEEAGIGIKKYIWSLEESVILTLKCFGIKGERLKGATGVWLNADIPGKTRKICAIGVRTSKFVTMHGFALNVNTDLKYFLFINHCGFVDKGVTSMQKELGKTQSVEDVKKYLKHYLALLLNLDIQ
ncbi:MAG: lipoate--protein ligase [Bacteroidetes bacterium CG23_combo_of_CG06-09_8_20_14_all_32_9]|nr:MAG: lipoate--protein ligase [Bacteroidetes bacterium CG23_combo_of_CG06-09_8_20_14_all_32_9]